MAEKTPQRSPHQHKRQPSRLLPDYLTPQNIDLDNLEVTLARGNVDNCAKILATHFHKLATNKTSVLKCSASKWARRAKMQGVANFVSMSNADDNVWFEWTLGKPEATDLGKAATTTQKEQFLATVYTETTWGKRNRGNGIPPNSTADEDMMTFLQSCEKANVKRVTYKPANEHLNTLCYWFMLVLSQNNPSDRQELAKKIAHAMKQSVSYTPRPPDMTKLAAATKSPQKYNRDTDIAPLQDSGAKFKRAQQAPWYARTIDLTNEQIAYVCIAAINTIQYDKRKNVSRMHSALNHVNFIENALKLAAVASRHVKRCAQYEEETLKYTAASYNTTLYKGPCDASPRNCTAPATMTRHKWATITLNVCGTIMRAVAVAVNADQTIVHNSRTKKHLFNVIMQSAMSDELVGNIAKRTVQMANKNQVYTVYHTRNAFAPLFVHSDKCRVGVLQDRMFLNIPCEPVDIDNTKVVNMLAIPDDRRLALKLIDNIAKVAFYIVNDESTIMLCEDMINSQRYSDSLSPKNAAKPSKTYLSIIVNDAEKTLHLTFEAQLARHAFARNDLMYTGINRNPDGLSHAVTLVECSNYHQSVAHYMFKRVLKQTTNDNFPTMLQLYVETSLDFARDDGNKKWHFYILDSDEDTWDEWGVTYNKLRTALAARTDAASLDKVTLSVVRMDCNDADYTPNQYDEPTCAIWTIIYCDIIARFGAKNLEHVVDKLNKKSEGRQSYYTILMHVINGTIPTQKATECIKRVFGIRPAAKPPSTETQPNTPAQHKEIVGFAAKDAANQVLRSTLKRKEYERTFAYIENNKGLSYQELQTNLMQDASVPKVFKRIDHVRASISVLHKSSTTIALYPQLDAARPAMENLHPRVSLYNWNMHNAMRSYRQQALQIACALIDDYDGNTPETKTNDIKHAIEALNAHVTVALTDVVKTVLPSVRMTQHHRIGIVFDRDTPQHLRWMLYIAITAMSPVHDNATDANRTNHRTESITVQAIRLLKTYVGSQHELPQRSSKQPPANIIMLGSSTGRTVDDPSNPYYTYNTTEHEVNAIEHILTTLDIVGIAYSYNDTTNGFAAVRRGPDGKHLCYLSPAGNGQHSINTLRIESGISSSYDKSELKAFIPKIKCIYFDNIDLMVRAKDIANWFVVETDDVDDVLNSSPIL
ncbi:MAG: hypothetical protein VW491_01325 [Gammaproteobacteria bacterium]